MSNVFIVALFDCRLSWLIRVDTNTVVDQVALDETLVFLSQRNIDGGYLRFIQEKNPQQVARKEGRESIIIFTAAY